MSKGRVADDPGTLLTLPYDLTQSERRNDEERVHTHFVKEAIEEVICPAEQKSGETLPRSFAFR